MTKTQRERPDNTAVRVALWRALHLELDPPPHVLKDDLGLKLAAPPADWRTRPDMHPERTKTFRASIIARARFIEDLVIEQARHGLDQYVILGAGLDTFAERHTASPRLTVFEVDQPETQAWKRRRLIETGLGLPDHLRLVPVDFEAGGSWLEKLESAEFNPKKPAVFASTGVSLYITREATKATLRQIAGLARGTIFAMTFMLPLELIDPALRPALEGAMKGARANGTPFISFYTPDEILSLAREAGFTKAEHVSPADHARRYFAGRGDGLSPASGEDMLVATR